MGSISVPLNSIWPIPHQIYQFQIEQFQFSSIYFYMLYKPKKIFLIQVILLFSDIYIYIYIYIYDNIYCIIQCVPTLSTYLEYLPRVVYIPIRIVTEEIFLN